MIQQEQPFNMALATLERINNLLIKLQEYNLGGNVAGIKNTLLEVYKELYPFLDIGEKKTAQSKWIKISGCFVKWVSHNELRFDSNLYDMLFDFDFWLRNKLYKKGLTMPTIKMDRMAVSLGKMGIK